MFTVARVEQALAAGSRAAHGYERNAPDAAGLVSYVFGNGGAALGSVSGCSPFDLYAIGSSRSHCGAAPAPTSTNANVFGFAKVTVNGRHQRPVANRNRGFHRPLPVPPSGRASHHDRTVVLGHRGEARLDVSTPGTITVAVRSTRHRRAVPPRRRSTPSIPSTRCGWSVQRGHTPRVRPECGSVLNNTFAFPPHDVGGPSNGPTRSH